MVSTPGISGDIRRKQIKNTALEIIFNEGMKNLSTHHLAQKVGLSDGAIFKHFHSKSDIIKGIIEDVKKELNAPLRKIAMENRSPDKRLKKFVCFHIDYLKKKQGITILLFTEASFQNNQGFNKDIDEIYHLQEKYFGKIIRDGINLKFWDKTVPVENLTTFYLGIPVALNIEINLHPDSFAYDNFCQKIYRLILKILNPEPSHNADE